MTEQSHKAITPGSEPGSGRDRGSAPTQSKIDRRRKLLLAGASTVIVAAALAIGVPWVRDALNTVSTDDAYVNGHVTFVGPRVRGQVARVLVDDNNRVRRGDVLVELDKEPYQTAVAVKRAAVDTAEADLRATIAKVRGIELRREGGAGTCSTPWRTSPTRPLNCIRGSPASTRARRHWRWRAGIRAGAAIGDDKQYSPVRAGSPAGGFGIGPRRPGAGRCTTLTKLPVAFWAGSSAKVDPVPIVKPAMRPLKTCLLPYMSTLRSTGWPIRRSPSCVSLKLASTQTSLSERIAMRPCPTWTLLPGLTFRRVITPSISATTPQLKPGGGRDGACRP